jgi:fructose-bisphosphate aldolase class I
MNQDFLATTAKRLTTPPKGILAADESSPTCDKRFEALGIPTTLENRRAYRELLLAAPEIENYISGFILFDETIRQSTNDGVAFTSLMSKKGLDIGIKVDQGLEDLSGHPGEKVTKGLETLPARLAEYHQMGATFAKWRAVYTVGAGTPSEECIKANAERFAQYALYCQAEDIVPMIEPEVLFDGTHSIDECFTATSKNLAVVFKELEKSGVYLPGIILKTSMVLAGKDNPQKSSPEEVAAKTLECLKSIVPANIGGVVFLSGGQGDEDSTLNLNAMHKGVELPWNLTFSYSRGIQNPVLKHWAEDLSDISGSQKILIEMVKKNSLASMGQYK